MHIISRKTLNEFAAIHPEAEGALDRWYRIMKSSQFNTFVELRADFPSADQVGKLFVFNVGGNKVRLITAIHFNTKKVFIRRVLTHAEYDEDSWKE